MKENMKNLINKPSERVANTVDTIKESVEKSTEPIKVLNNRINQINETNKTIIEKSLEPSKRAIEAVQSINKLK